MKVKMSLNKNGINKAKSFLIKNYKRLGNFEYNLNIHIEEVNISALIKDDYEMPSLETKSGRPEVINFNEDDFLYEDVSI